MRLFLTIFAVLFCTFSAHAASDKEILVDNLFELLEFEETMKDSAADTFTIGVKQVLETQGKSLSEEKISIIREAFLKEYLPRIPEIITFSKGVYVETFTQKELQRAFDFHDSPEGIQYYKKSLEVMKTLMVFSSKITIEAGHKAGLKLQNSSALK